MNESREQTTYRHARREALVTLLLFAVTCTYTVVVSYVLGYDRPTEDVKLVWGIPRWVFYGILAPWAVMFPVTAWFCFRFMADDDLAGSPDERGSSDA